MCDIAKQLRSRVECGKDRNENNIHRSCHIHVNSSGLIQTDPKYIYSSKYLVEKYNRHGTSVS